MSIALRAAQGSNNGSGGTSIAMAVPTGTQDGDLMLLGINARGGTNAWVTPDGVVPAGALADQMGFSIPPIVTSSYCYVADYTTGTVKAINTSTKAVTSIPVGTNPDSMCITPNGSYIYVSNVGSSNVSVIRTSDNTVIATVTLASAPGTGICANNTYVFVPLSGTTSLVVINVSGNTVNTTLTVPSGCIFPQMSPDNAYCWLTGGTSGTVLTRVNASALSVANYTIGSSGATNCACSVTSDSSKVLICTADGVAIFRASDGVQLDYGLGGYETNRAGLAVVGSSKVYRVLRSKFLVQVIDLTTSAIKHFFLPGGSRNSSATQTPYLAAAATPDGSHVYVTGVLSMNGGNAIWEIDTTTDTVSSTRSTNANATSSTNSPIAVSPDSTTVWVYGYGSGVAPGWVHYFAVGSAGWTPLARWNSTTTLNGYLFYRWASSEPSSYTFVINPTELASGVILSISGADSIVNLQGAGQNNGSSTNITAPSLGTFMPTNGMDVGFFGTAYGTTISAPGGGYAIPTNGQSKSTGTTLATASAVAYLIQNVQALNSTLVATATNAAVNIGLRVWVTELESTTQAKVRFTEYGSAANASSAVVSSGPFGAVSVGDMKILSIAAQGGKAAAAKDADAVAWNVSFGTVSTTTVVTYAAYSKLNVGDVVCVGFYYAAGSGTVSAVDNVGNVYSVVEQTSSSGVTTAFLYAVITNQAAAYNWAVITITHPSATYRAARVFHLKNVVYVGAAGGLAGASGTTATWANSVTIPANGCAVGFAASRANPGYTAGSASGSPSTSITLESDTGDANGDVSSLYAIAGASAVTGFTGTATLGSSNAWAAAGAIFAPAPAGISPNGVPYLSGATGSHPYGGAWSPDGKVVVTVNQSTITVFQVDVGIYRNIPLTVSYAPAWSPDGSKCYVTDGTYLYEFLSPGFLLNRSTAIAGWGSLISNPVVSPDGQYLYWPTQTSWVLYKIKISDWSSTSNTIGQQPWSTCLSADGAYFWWCGIDSVNYIVKTSDMSKVSIASPTSVSSGWSTCVSSPDGASVYWAGGNSTVSKLYKLNASTGTTSQTAPDSHTYSAQSIHVSPDASVVYVVWVYGYGLYAYDASDLSQKASATSEQFSYADVGNAAFTSDGLYAYVNNSAGDIFTIRLSDGAILQKLVTNWPNSYLLASPTGPFMTVHTYLNNLSQVTNAISLYTTHSYWTPLLSTASPDGYSLVQSLFSHVVSDPLEQISYTPVLFDGAKKAKTATYASCLLTGIQNVLSSGMSVAGQGNASSTSIVAPSVGSFASGSGVAVGAFSVLGSYDAITAPSGYTQATSSGTVAGAQTTIEVSFMYLSGVTSVASATATAGVAGINVGQQVFVYNYAPPPVPYAGGVGVSEAQGGLV